MGKKRALGQDPLTWIRRTDDAQPPQEAAEISVDTSGEAPDVSATVVENGDTSGAGRETLAAEAAGEAGVEAAISDREHTQASEIPPAESSDTRAPAVEETTPAAVSTDKKEAMTANTGVTQEKGQEEAVVARLADFESFAEAPAEDLTPTKKMSVLMDLTLPLTVELGRTEMLIKDILKLRQGTMIELDKLAGEPVDLVVNGRKLAEGEVVVIDDYFGIRITDLAEDPEQQIKELQSLGGGR